MCPNTCGNPSASEDPFAEFLVLLFGTDVIRANCSVLAGTSSDMKDFVCNLDLSIWIDYTPSVACCETCDATPTLHPLLKLVRGRLQLPHFQRAEHKSYELKWAGEKF